MKVPGEDFWLAEKEGEVAGYALAHVAEGVDGKLTYWVEQGFVHPHYRDGKGLKEGWQDLEKRARELFCSHLINVTNRNPRVYLRFLGDGWHEYTHCLKKDLGG